MEDDEFCIVSSMSEAKISRKPSQNVVGNPTVHHSHKSENKQKPSKPKDVTPMKPNVETKSPIPSPSEK